MVSGQWPVDFGELDANASAINYKELWVAMEAVKSSARVPGYADGV